MVFNASTHVHKAGWAEFPQLQKYFFPPLYYPFGTPMELIVKKKKSLNILHFYSVY